MGGDSREVILWMRQVLLSQGYDYLRSSMPDERALLYVWVF